MYRAHALFNLNLISEYTYTSRITVVEGNRFEKKEQLKIIIWEVEYMICEKRFSTD